MVNDSVETTANKLKESQLLLKLEEQQRNLKLETASVATAALLGLISGVVSDNECIL